MEYGVSKMKTTIKNQMKTIKVREGVNVAVSIFSLKHAVKRKQEHP